MQSDEEIGRKQSLKRDEEEKNTITFYSMQNTNADEGSKSIIKSQIELYEIQYIIVTWNS